MMDHLAHRSAVLSISLLAVLLCPLPAPARTWYITPDGTGDAPTIQAGVDSAAVGDTVEVACGSFLEHGIIMKSGLVLRGESPSRCAVIDAQYAGRGITCSDVDASTVIANLVSQIGVSGSGGGISITDSEPKIINCEFRDNYSSRGGALSCVQSSPVIESCTFESNYGWGRPGLGGGIHCDSSALEIRDCEFLQNIASEMDLPSSGLGGAIYATSSSLTIADCSFLENRADGSFNGKGGAIWLQDTQATIVRCEFTANWTWGSITASGGAISTTAGNVQIDECVFVRNEAEEGAALALGPGSVTNCTIFQSVGDAVHSYAGPLLENTMIVFGSEGVAFAGTPPTLRCCNVFHNAGGDWVGALEGLEGVDGNFSAWPLFCNPASDDLHLSENSICLPANNSCDALIGALGAGCGPVSIEPMSWARIKGRYR